MTVSEDCPVCSQLPWGRKTSYDGCHSQTSSRICGRQRYAFRQSRHHADKAFGAGGCARHLRSRVMLKSELLEFLEETADAAFCVSQQGEICSWNAAAEKLFGYSSSEAIGQSCYGLLQCRSSLGTKLCTREFYARQATGEHCRIPNFDLEVRVRSCRRIWVDLSTLVFEDGRTHPRLIVHLSRDITERKHHEDLLHKIIQLSKHIVAVSDSNGIGRPAPVSPGRCPDIRKCKLLERCYTGWKIRL
jgi:PAS domain S-box-containing protein